MFLQIENLKKSYGKRTAVNNLSFSLEQGTALGMLGPNGAGKSTTIAMIASLLQPDAGKIIFKGEDIYQNNLNIRKVLGYVPQEIALFEDLNALDNLRFFGKAYGLKGDELKKRVEIVTEQIGLQDRLKDKVKTFSGGMKRRLNIGAAILHQPEFLILDEPTVGIDPQSRNHILELVKKFNQEGMSVLYTSHYMNEIEAICNQILIIDQGENIAYGTKKELLAEHEGDNLEQVFLALTGRELRD